MRVTIRDLGDVSRIMTITRIVKGSWRVDAIVRNAYGRENHCRHLSMRDSRCMCPGMSLPDIREWWRGSAAKRATCTSHWSSI